MSIMTRTVSSSTNPYAGAYPWDYLKPENSDRPAILESIVAQYIEEGDAVFDICCGFSPLSAFFLRKQCRVTGFDISAEAIEYCTRAYPGGVYHSADDAHVSIPERVDVLVHIGIPRGTDPWGLESRTEVSTSIRTILRTRPRLIVLESAVEHSSGHTVLKNWVEMEREYDLLEEVTYEFHPHVGSVNPHASSAYKRVLSMFRRRAVRSTPRNYCSLSDETLTRLFTDLNPSAQAESLPDRNLGFGFLYYAIARIIRPKFALVLGSQRGFSAILFALGIRDNANGGKLVLVDAAYDDFSDGRYPGYGGIGFWKDSAGVAKLLDSFGVADVIEVAVMRTSEFAGLYESKQMPPVDLLFIDADHSYPGFKNDFETYSKFVAPDGLTLCHDTEVQDGFGSMPFGIGKYLKSVIQRDPRYQAMSLPVWPGLGIIRKAGPVRGAPSPSARTGRRPLWWRYLRTVYRRLPLPQAARLRLGEMFYLVINRVNRRDKKNSNAGPQP